MYPASFIFGVIFFASALWKRMWEVSKHHHRRLPKRKIWLNSRFYFLEIFYQNYILTKFENFWYFSICASPGEVQSTLALRKSRYYGHSLLRTSSDPRQKRLKKVTSAITNSKRHSESVRYNDMQRELTVIRNLHGLSETSSILGHVLSQMGTLFFFFFQL